MPGQGGEFELSFPDAEVRRYGAGFHGDTRSPAEREQLVQRPAGRQLRRDGCHVGFRRVLPGEELLRPGQRHSLGERDVHGQGRDYRVGRLRAQIRRDCTAGDGYASQYSRVSHFGLGDATAIDELEVTWPNGKRTKQDFRNLQADQFIEIDENKGEVTVIRGAVKK